MFGIIRFFGFRLSWGVGQNGPTPSFARKIPEVVDFQRLTGTMQAGKYVNEWKSEDVFARSTQIRH